jgi:hypothetical protein
MAIFYLQAQCCTSGCSTLLPASRVLLISVASSIHMQAVGSALGSDARCFVILAVAARQGLSGK